MSSGDGDFQILELVGGPRDMQGNGTGNSQLAGTAEFGSATSAVEAKPDAVLVVVSASGRFFHNIGPAN
jgi:hypothetical protein